MKINGVSFYLLKFIKILIFRWHFPTGSRTIAPEENCPTTLILTLTLNQTLTLTKRQFSSWAIFWTPFQTKITLVYFYVPTIFKLLYLLTMFKLLMNRKKDTIFKVSGLLKIVF